MRGLRKYLTPFAPDQSGAVSVLYELGGIVVVCDAGGCTGNICGFDEPRWTAGIMGTRRPTSMMRSAVFSAGLRDMDAILGRDDRLVAELADAARKIEANFAAIVGTPVPAVIGTDYRALCRMAEAACDLPVIAVDTTGMELFDVGASKAYVALFDRFATREYPLEEGRVCHLGANPLDMGRIPPKELSLSFADVERASAAQKNVVLAPSGLATARLLQERFGTPYEFANGAGPLFGPHAPAVEVSGKRVLVVQQQIVANAWRRELLGRGAASVTCATWFMQLGELAQEGDVRLREEDDFAELVHAGDFDVLVGDPSLWRIVAGFSGATVSAPEFAVSGELVRS